MGYNNVTDQFESTWVDSMSTGTMMSKGTLSADKKTLTMNSECFDPMTKKPCAGREVVTVEGLQAGASLHPLQAALADCGAAQCGYCTPGILCTAMALLREDPAPSQTTITKTISKHLCHYTNY